MKEKCMMGPKADCDRCGCVVPFYMASLTNRKQIAQQVHERRAPVAPSRMDDQAGGLLDHRQPLVRVDDAWLGGH